MLPEGDDFSRRSRLVLLDRCRLYLRLRGLLLRLDGQLSHVEAVDQVTDLRRLKDEGGEEPLDLVLLAKHLFVVKRLSVQS